MSAGLNKLINSFAYLHPIVVLIIHYGTKIQIINHLISIIRLKMSILIRYIGPYKAEKKQHGKSQRFFHAAFFQLVTIS